jgi:hypothetical protein
MDIISVFETEGGSSILSGPAKFCPHSIMDNILAYEAGDCGSIPYAGASFVYVCTVNHM